jgi:Tfp pilus assembly protein PilV
MKIIAAFIMSGVLLGGCASFDVHERRLADYQRECSRDGYKYGTPIMAQCVESKSRARKVRQENYYRRAEKRWVIDLELIE